MLDALIQAFEQQLREAGSLAMGGQIVDATSLPAPKHSNSEEERAAIKADMSARQIWRGKPKGKPMPEHTAGAKAAKPAIRARAEHVFAHQKNRHAIFMRPIGCPCPGQAHARPSGLQLHPLIFLQQYVTTG